MLMLDTSALFYWTLDPQHLSPEASQAIEQSERLVISSISVWEIALKAARGALEVPMSMAEYTALLDQLEQLEIIPVDVRTWLDNVALDWDHRDPADRTIVALATQLQCPIVTNDRKIAAFYSDIVW